MQLFYYFIESERDSAADPLVLWLTGGPGCSGFSALAFEIGQSLTTSFRFFSSTFHQTFNARIRLSLYKDLFSFLFVSFCGLCIRVEVNRPSPIDRSELDTIRPSLDKRLSGQLCVGSCLCWEYTRLSAAR